LVVGGSWTGLPNVVTAPDGEVACVVVDDDLIDLPTVPAGCVVCVHDEVDVGLEGVPVLHQRCSLSVWVSVHSLQEAIRAEESSANAILAGHIYETDCKKGLPGRGLEFLTSIIEQVDIPVYAIGGIDQFNIEEVASAGASGACQMSYYMKL